MPFLDEDRLYENIEKKYKFSQGEARKAYSDVLDTICEMPSADVEEVRHGKWIDYSDNFDRGMDLRCSVCNMRASAFVSGPGDWWDSRKPNYCPHCGVRMDGKE